MTDSTRSHIPPKPMPSVGPEELAIFQFVQDSGPVTVRQAAEHFAALGKARTTVLTVMERLRCKGLLSREKVGSTFRYQSCVPRGEVMQSLVGDFVRRVLGGSVTPFMAYMSDSDQISETELEELKKIVETIEKRHSEGKQ
ncbi:Methicillin resistance regulatory protein MecI [Rubripirellula tenax]|uniref:Methicillin resistance regulatory protein MecI n=1 Tax=Rubripirellula tenax TaxID=2528015 RepID=A0A5C6FAH7_9BACT|nr:BlaI/MecI/CopY family transcriptional regulator [Rubripirellula tenax]TWU56599.1 Methicillin resistance regulatory protein MecI [Rubripirellula tenax]